MSERSSYIALTQTPECQQWLTHALTEAGELIPADTPSIERILQLSDAIGASAIFIQLTAGNYRQETLLIEGLVAAKPFLPVLVVSDTVDQDLLLASMRVGARDFIQIGTRATEVAATVKRLAPKDASAYAAAQTTSGGRITTVISARPGSDAPMFALHLALAIQESEPTLLLDLGAPHGDAMLYLGLTASYSFIDAVRSLRRIDATLIQTGFGRHKSGLTVLSMPEEPWTGTQFTSADVYVLLRTLRRYFSHIVINLGGMARSDFLMLLLSNADRQIMLIEQSVPSCRQNLQLLKHMREEKINLERAGLVVDRYLSRMPPDAESIAQSFGLPLLGTLSPSGMARLATMNSGESMFALSPNDPYVISVRKLAQQVMGAEESNTARQGSLLQRLASAVKPGKVKAA
jgi:pilus assembly protein CpaE